MNIPAFGICDECLNNTDNIARNEDMFIVFCPHNQTGAMMLLKNNKPINERWRLLTPISFDDFKIEVSNAVKLQEAFKIHLQKKKEREDDPEKWWNAN